MKYILPNMSDQNISQYTVFTGQSPESYRYPQGIREQQFVNHFFIVTTQHGTFLVVFKNWIMFSQYLYFNISGLINI